MSVYEDLTSKDPHRIWAASCAVRTLRDSEALEFLASHIDEIKDATRGIHLGGALRLSSTHLDFALKKLEFIKNESGRCLCNLYPMDDLYDPQKEALAKNVVLLSTTYVDEKWVNYYDCRCTQCAEKYRVIESEYHHPRWNWQQL